MDLQLLDVPLSLRVVDPVPVLHAEPLHIFERSALVADPCELDSTVIMISVGNPAGEHFVGKGLVIWLFMPVDVLLKSPHPVERLVLALPAVQLEEFDPFFQPIARP